ncbi:MAG: DUF4230 domain-containing protein [Synergistaceae bacterium]|nr:DUF4230 domain-containing protein [Synergistaceae bacterium]MBQ3398998.1 DUF4230 domain-containing protein [Synergistaceae bacterium]MBQ3759008.1 DUF4230 domain-containing protein [Synergistaceae bacterium]MBQ4400622.1 DUF4230 domain-containing protein [Synergistaceae bacterium]MBQ6115673.1 DUF4230 domain-containing protein [Synergistaceae bacterium]
MTAAIALVLALVVSITVNVMLVLRRKVSKNRSVRTTILSGIQNVSELATIRERFQSIVSFSDGMKIPGLNMNIPGTTRKFMLKYYGTIVCGCDLSKAQVSERFDVNRVRITLPHSEILDIYADVHSFEVYDQSAGIFTSVKLEDQNREVDSDLLKVKAHELERGILSQSDENVRKILTSVVASTGMEAEIVFTGNDRPELGASETVLQLESATAE